MTTHTFAAGQRVYHDVAGCYCYGRWMEYEASESGPHGYSRIQVENSNGATMLCPTSTLRPTGEDD